MRKFLSIGLRLTVHRWPVWVFLYAASTVPTLVFGAVAWARLQSALDHSLAARSLLSDLDANVFIDLFLHRGAGLSAIPITALLVGVTTMVVWVWLNGATAAAASDTPALGAALRRGGNLFVPFLRLWALSLLVNVCIVALAYGCGDRLLWWTAESASEMVPYWVVAGCAGAAALLLFLARVVHDHARLRLAATDCGALPAYRWALRFCLHDQRRAIVIAAVVLFTGVLLWGLYQSLTTLIVPTSTPGVVASLLWGQVLILARFATRFWAFAAANELQVAATEEWDDTPRASSPPALLAGPNEISR